MKKLIIAASMATLFSASAVAAPAHKHGHHRHHTHNHQQHHNNHGSNHKFHRDLFNLALFIGAAVAIDAALDSADDQDDRHHGPKPQRGNHGHHPHGNAYGHHNQQHRAKFTINERQQRQLKRIRAGVESGALLRDEAKRLRRQQRRIAELEADFRADGRFTKQERATIQAKLDHASERIYRLKHNDYYR